MNVNYERSSSSASRNQFGTSKLGILKHKNDEHNHFNRIKIFLKPPSKNKLQKKNPSETNLKDFQLYFFNPLFGSGTQNYDRTYLT